MSDLSPELNLALCVDDDDTADYLVQTAGLHGSLLVLDGMFNSATGHSHNGAHQGGALHFQDLLVGGNLNVTGSSDQHGIGHFYSALSVDGQLTLGSGLTVAGGTSVQALTVGGSQTIAGSLSVSQYLNVTGAVSAGGPVASGTPFGGGGDLSSHRSDGSGYVFLGSNSHYVGWDGSNYQMPAGLLYVGGDRVVTEVAGQTLSNKTLAAPTINGAVAWNAAQNFPAPSKESSLNLLAVANATDWIVDYGTTGLISTPNGGVANQAVGFNRAFTVAPYVLVSITYFSGTPTSIPTIGVIAHNVSTSGFQVDLGNASGGSQGIMVGWIAIGR